MRSFLRPNNKKSNSEANFKGRMGETDTPNDIALTKIVAARMKMINDALPRKAITFVTTCCPARAAMTATPKK